MVVHVSHVGPVLGVGAVVNVPPVGEREGGALHPFLACTLIDAAVSDYYEADKIRDKTQTLKGNTQNATTKNDTVANP